MTWTFVIVEGIRYVVEFKEVKARSTYFSVAVAGYCELKVCQGRNGLFQPVVLGYVWRDGYSLSRQRRLGNQGVKPVWQKAESLISFTHRQQRERTGRGYSLSNLKAHLKGNTPPSSLCFLNILKHLPKSTTSLGQVFKYKSLQGTFLIHNFLPWAV